MNTESYSPAPQLAILLPHHDDIKVLLEFFEKEGDDASPLVGAIRRLTADIINNPNNSELWFDLSRAFGLWGLIEWKYLFVAHRIDPENTTYLDYLAWNCYRMGDHQQAISLVSKAIAIADKDEDRLPLIKSRMMMDKQFDTAIV